MASLRKYIKWGAIVLAPIVVILLLAVGFLAWRSGSSLGTRLDALRAAGDPVELIDLQRSPIPDDQNACVVLTKVEKDLTALEKKWSTLYKSPEYRTNKLTEEQIKTIEADLAAYPNLLPLLRKAAACPDSDARLNYTAPTTITMTIISFSSKMRSAVRMLVLYNHALLQHQQYDKAIENCTTTLQLAHHVEREPMLTSFLVAVACRHTAMESANRTLRSGPVSEESRKALEDALAQATGMKVFRHALKTERVLNMANFKTLPGANIPFIRMRWQNDLCATLDQYEKLLATLDLPLAEQKSAASSNKAPVLTSLLMPAIKAVQEAATRDQALVRCLRVFNAIQQWEQQDGNSGKVPKLSDLQLPAEATVDPFDGKPLRVKKTAQGWVVYSVGRNLKDEGGEELEFTDKTPKDFGFGPIPK